jgi:hypothetical protein
LNRAQVIPASPSQEHPPKRPTTSNCDELDAKVGGAPFDHHLLFEPALSFSGYRWPTVALSESFEVLALGVQGALWQLGGVVEVLRYDNLSAPTRTAAERHMGSSPKPYSALLEYYGMKSTRMFSCEAHENRIVEQVHRRTKRRPADRCSGAALASGTCLKQSPADAERGFQPQGSPVTFSRDRARSRSLGRKPEHRASH